MRSGACVFLALSGEPRRSMAKHPGGVRAPSIMLILSLYPSGAAAREVLKTPASAFLAELAGK